MLDNEILDQALSKKNKEFEKSNKNFEEQKKTYETKIKNLMNSINTLKTQNQELTNSNKDNVRVNQIKTLKQEINDKEKVIFLLRKLIDDDEKTDNFILKEFSKLGDQRVLTNEELKIKIKKLETDVFNLKNKKSNNDDKDNVQVKLYEEKISVLENENDKLKETNQKLIQMQNEMFDKIKLYNQEMGEMKSIYDTVKYNLQEENKLKLFELNNRVEQSENENVKLKEKIREMIVLAEDHKKHNNEILKKANSEIDMFKRLLESKKQEINILVDEINKYKGYFENKETKYIKIDNPVNKELEQKIIFLEKQVKQKDYQIEQMRKSLNDKDSLINEKDMEIDLINNKLVELEQIAIQNYNKF